MLVGYHPVWQALMGTFVTWGLTALGSAMVYLIDLKDVRRTQKILDGMLGFAAGVMLAASYWSLLAPAIDAAESMEAYGKTWAWFPAAVGFGCGAFSMLGAEHVLKFVTRITASKNHPKKNDDLDAETPSSPTSSSINSAFGVEADANSVRRALLLVVAITIHNFPEGMAVGVGFGSASTPGSSSFANAFNLAIGIGLQNFPEGLAVSMPLRRAGMSSFNAFMWGQASGMVEPLGGMLGAWAVMTVKPMLPYALSYAAGAMIFVVVDDLIPEASSSGNQRLATIGTIIGFIVMMIMDVALG